MHPARLWSLLDRLFARRRVVVAVALVLGAVAHLAATSLFSWHFVVEGSRLLWSHSGLHLYAVAPNLQMGPLTFVVGGLFAVALPPVIGAAGAIVLMLAIGFAVILATSSMVPADDATRRRGWIAGAVVAAAVWTEVAVHYGHLDDALALAAGIAAVRLARDGRVVTAALLVGLAIDFKPWALPLVGVVLAAPSMRRAALAVVVLVGVVTVVWLPFVLADPHTLRILHFAIPVAHDSTLAVFGSHARSTPAWDRAVQLGGATALVAVIVARRRWHAVILVLVAFRMLLDPATYLYYDAGLVAGAIELDAGSRGLGRRGLPLATALTAVGVTAAGYLVPSPADGYVRTVALVAILLAALVPALARRGSRFSTDSVPPVGTMGSMPSGVAEPGRTGHEVQSVEGA